jgi:hypothetical protein
MMEKSGMIKKDKIGRPKIPTAMDLILDPNNTCPEELMSDKLQSKLRKLIENLLVTLVHGEVKGTKPQHQFTDEVYDPDGDKMEDTLHIKKSEGQQILKEMKGDL